MITGLYAVILAVLQITYTLNIVKIRRGERISLGDGGHDDLQRAMRAHGNFTETVPIGLILILAAEFGGAHWAVLHLAGLMLLAGRVIHHYSLTKRSDQGGNMRPLGMQLTIASWSVAGVVCLWAFIAPLL